MESIENPLGSYSRLEADNGVHMRVDYLWIRALLLHLCFYPSFWFQYSAHCPLLFQIVLQDQDNRQSRSTNVGEKSFRCEYEGCGKLYTTAHHLKVGTGNPSEPALTFWASFAYSELSFPHRYMNVPTLETNRTSAIFLAAGRSLPQVKCDTWSYFLEQHLMAQE